MVFARCCYGQYLNFNSFHPYTVKKVRVCCLQHRAKTISSDTDAYQEEIISLRHNLQRDNYPERITSAPRTSAPAGHMETDAVSWFNSANNIKDEDNSSKTLNEKKIIKLRLRNLDNWITWF